MSRVRIKLRYGERNRVIREMLEALAASQIIFNSAGERSLFQYSPDAGGICYHQPSQIG